jgi:hypothetical protein
MRRHLRPFLALTLLTGTLTACQQPDVGSRCVMSWGDGTSSPAPTPDSVQGDYFESGNTACDDLVCIVSPVTSGKYASCSGNACGYCSKPCVSDQDCYKSQTGLVCRQMVLDPIFLASLDQATKDQYLAGIQFSSYCAVPR